MTSDVHGAAAPEAPARRRRDWLLGLALLAAFSPTVLDLLRHWMLEPWSRYSALFLPLLAWCVHRGPASRRRVGAGALLIAGGLALQLLAVLAAAPRVARPALAAGLAGFLLVRGLAPPATALLAGFVVPVPYQLAAQLAGLPLAVALFRATAFVLSSVGLALAVDHHALVATTASFDLRPIHAGLPLVVAVTGLALYASRRRSLSRAAGLELWGRLLLAACAIQLAAVVLSALALVAGWPGASGVLLESLPVWIVVVLVVARTERSVEWPAAGARARRGMREEPGLPFREP